ncbi:mCG144522, partial [Mus musculus]
KEAYIRTMEEGRFPFSTCQHIYRSLLLQDSSLFTRPAETPSLKGLSNTAAHCWGNWAADGKSPNL